MFSKFIHIIVIVGFLTGCAVISGTPRPTTLTERLDSFPAYPMPLKGSVNVYWDKHQIPFIDGEHDSDVAFVLGSVHAHLRLGQLEFLRRVSQGRISEMAGPFTTDIDHALKILDLGKATPRIIEQLPDDTKLWLESFVAGINYYQQHVKELPHELKILGVEREPWQLSDIITLSRLYAVDVNWLVWLSALTLTTEKNWQKRWSEYLALGWDSTASFKAGAESLEKLNALLVGLSRSGSNSVVVSGERSRNRAALIASDPHLGILFPNIWLIAGYRSPGYHVVGLMLPGAPFVALGRNPDIAWGGTNMRGLSSSFYDMSDEDPSKFNKRKTKLSIRFWPDREIEITESAFGPVITEAPFFKEKGIRPLALKWVGHEPSDEISAFLKLNRASDFSEFKEAFRDYAVSAQNFLYADKEGSIGQILAVKRPVHASAKKRALLLDPKDPEDIWHDYLYSADLPFSYNPVEGFLASANNRPVDTGYPLGYVYAANNRIERLSELLDGEEVHSVDSLTRLQQDSFSESSFRIKELLKADLYRLRDISDDEQLLVDRLISWDGFYNSESEGAAAFETLMTYFAPEIIASLYKEESFKTILNRGGRWKAVLIKQLSADGVDFSAELRKALASATASVNVDGRLITWGEKHKISIGHPLKNVPLIGQRYKLLSFTASGSVDTVQKAAHQLSSSSTEAFYGSNARHISDLSSPDENYFVLLGGQDGWFNSENSLDQVKLWQRQLYVKVPLSIEGQKAGAKKVWKLTQAKQN